jgi:ATP-dependent helicase/nuclease subunit B
MASQDRLPFDREPEAVAPAAGDPFVRQLADLCRAHPTRAKWVFVPSLAAGHALGERLARTGTSWANLRFATPFDVAIRMAGPFLVEGGLDPTEDTLGPALVMRLLAALPAGMAYFRPMAEQETLAAALWNAIRELRLAGLRSGDLCREAFASAEKHAELAALLAAYETHLEAHRVADAAVVFRRALEDGRFCPVLPGDCWLEMPDVVWPPLVRRLLDALPGERLRPRTARVPGLEVPPRVAALAAAAERVETPAPTDAARLRFLRRPEAAGAPRGDSSLDLFHAGGRDAEIEEVFRRALAAGRPLDEIEIVCASEADAVVVWEKARRLDWAVTVSAGVPAALTRPGRALLGWCAWIAGGFAAADLRRLLQSGDLEPVEFASAPPLSAMQAARLLLRAEATWGRETYARTFEAHAARDEARAREADEPEAAWRRQRAAQARRLAAWVADLLAAVPAPDPSGAVPFGAVLEAAAQFLARNAARAGDLDAAAAAALGDLFENLGTLAPVTLPLPVTLRHLTGAVAALRVGASRARPGHLHVSTLADGGIDGRPVVFVIGLEEARVFPPAIEDPVLLDEERRALSRANALAVPLRTADDRLAEAVHAVVSRLAAIGLSAERVTLSCSAIDAREFRETFPSWIVLQAFRLKTGDPGAGFDRLREWLGEPASAVPHAGEAATTDAGWWLHAGRAGQAAEAAVLAAHADLARGREAGRGRESDELSPFDGFVPEAGPDLDPTRTGRPVAPTTLEQAAECPFRFFLHEGLGLEPLDEAEPDADVWLDPLTRGAELHELFAALGRRARAAGRRMSRAEDLAWLLERGRARLEVLRSETPPPSEHVFTVEARALLDDLETFLDAEERRAADAVAFEVTFGRGQSDPCEPLARRDPVPIDVGRDRPLLASGRIDRIDRIGRHAYEVIDYKTGRFWRDGYTGTFRGGRLLQHAVYGRAAERLLAAVDPAARVTRVVYWFPTARGWGRRVEIPTPDAAALAGVLGDLVEVIARGTFVHSADENVCARCPFRKACGEAPWMAAARKVAANVDRRLDAWIRLGAHV